MPYTISSVIRGNDIVSQLLCISTDNNPSLGDYYPDPAAGNVNAQVLNCPAEVPGPPTTLLATAYGLEDQLVVDYGSSGAPNFANFTLPYAGLSSGCNEALQVGFLTRVPSEMKSSMSSCSQTFLAADLPVACGTAGSQWSPLTYTSGIGFLRYPSDNGSPIYPALDQILIFNTTTGILTANTSALTDPVWSALTLTCSNMVQSISYNIYYDALRDLAAPTQESGKGTISQVVVEVVLQDLSVAAGATSVSLEQSFSVFWTPSQVTGVVQEQSGNPGYQNGFPLLAGVRSVDGTTLSRYVDGLPLPLAAADGTCSPAASGTVKFGYNTSSTCFVANTRAQLQALCDSPVNGTAVLEAALGAGYSDMIMRTASGGNVVGRRVQVGVWGNSNSSVPGDWVDLDVQVDTSRVAGWNDATGSCERVVTGYDVQILTGVAYAADNLQSKVLYARLCLRYGTWLWDGRPSAAAVQSFLMEFTVSYVPMVQLDRVSSVRLAPPLFTPLPTDLFYPFLSDSSSNSAGSMPAVGSLLAIFLAALTACLSCT